MGVRQESHSHFRHLEQISFLLSVIAVGQFYKHVAQKCCHGYGGKAVKGSCQQLAGNKAENILSARSVQQKTDNRPYVKRRRKYKAEAKAFL